MQEFVALNLRWATFSCYQAGSVNVNLFSSTSCFCVFIRTNAASFVSIEAQFHTSRRGKTNAHGRMPASLPSAPPLHLQIDLSTCITPVEWRLLSKNTNVANTRWKVGDYVWLKWTRGYAECSRPLRLSLFKHVCRRLHGHFVFLCRR